jgi:hypothetical protein
MGPYIKKAVNNIPTSYEATSYRAFLIRPKASQLSVLLMGHHVIGLYGNFVSTIKDCFEPFAGFSLP